MARGSRYHSKRLVGPATMENLSWIDIAKANLHIGNIVPVPSRNITNSSFMAVGITLGDAIPGSILRFVPTGEALPATPATGTIQFRTGITTNTDSVVVGGTISFNRQSDPFLVVVPPTATHIVVLQSVDLLDVEVILDD